MKTILSLLFVVLMSMDINAATYYWNADKNHNGEPTYVNSSCWFTDAACTNAVSFPGWNVDSILWGNGATTPLNFSSHTIATGNGSGNDGTVTLTGTCNVTFINNGYTISGGLWTGTGSINYAIGQYSDSTWNWGVIAGGTFTGAGFTNYGDIQGNAVISGSNLLNSSNSTRDGIIKNGPVISGSGFINNSSVVASTFTVPWVNNSIVNNCILTVPFQNNSLNGVGNCTIYQSGMTITNGTALLNYRCIITGYQPSSTNNQYYQFGSDLFQ